MNDYQISVNESIAMFEVSRSVKPWDHLKDEVVQPMMAAARRVANPAGTFRVQAYPPEGGMAGGREVRSDVMGPWAGADGIGTDLPTGEYLIIGITEGT